MYGAIRVMCHEHPLTANIYSPTAHGLGPLVTGIEGLRHSQENWTSNGPCSVTKLPKRSFATVAVSYSILGFFD